MEIADMFYNKDEFVETASGNKVDFENQMIHRKMCLNILSILR